MNVLFLEVHASGIKEVGAEEFFAYSSGFLAQKPLERLIDAGKNMAVAAGVIDALGISRTDGLTELEWRAAFT